MKGCVFCKLASGEIPCEKIYENLNFFSIFDANPKIEGHALVISKKHFETCLDLPVLLGNDLVDCIKKTSLKILEKTNSEGFNVLSNNKEVAGQEINHLHFHIICRKAGDGVFDIIPRKKGDNLKL